MKLRFRENSLRLRVNRREAESLCGGASLEEYVHFPGDAQLGYVLQGVSTDNANVEFAAGTIRVSVPLANVRHWAQTDAIGIYFDLPANGSFLKVAIEKDLECVDGPPSERDPYAFARSGKNC